MNQSPSPPASYPEDEEMDPVGEPYPNQDTDVPTIPNQEPEIPQDPESERTVPPEPLGT